MFGCPPGAVGARRLAGLWALWRRVADLSYPFKMMRSSKLHSTAQVDDNLQDGSLQGIVVMGDWSLQDWKLLVDDNVS